MILIKITSISWITLTLRCSFPFIFTIRLARIWNVRYFRRAGCDGPVPLASTLTLLGVIESVGVALASSVIEFVAAVASGVVVPLAEGAAARADHSWQNADVLRLAAPTLALLAIGESVGVSVASPVDKLFADAVAPVVEPLQLRFIARSFLFRQETKFYGNNFDFSQNIIIILLFDYYPTDPEFLVDRFGRFGDHRRHCRVATLTAGVQSFKVVGVATATSVEESAAFLIRFVVVPSFGKLFTVADFARHAASVLFYQFENCSQVNMVELRAVTGN